MGVRTSMGDLILRVRTLIYDNPAGGFPSTGTSVFSDQQVQDFLDHHQTILRYAELQPAPDLNPGGVLSYTEYVSGNADWESDVVLKDAAFAQPTIASSDLINGVWTLSTSTTPPIFATGKVYDVYAAAADACEAWAAVVALRFDFSTSDQRFSASQQRVALLEMAERFRQRAKPRTVDMVRSDAMAPDLHYLNSLDFWGERWW